ncbi:MAG: alpha-2-macroglobulin family protein, partial [Bacteroidota bacterium]
AGTVFSDRGLYRAGETAHLKGILRGRTDGDWATFTDSIRVLVTDSRDEIVVDHRLQPSTYGSFDLTYRAPTDASLGVYQVRVVRADDEEAEERESWQAGDLAQGTFRVDAFRTATFAVDAVPAARAFVAGDFFEGTVTGRYLFGAAMGGQPLRYRLIQQNGRYTPPGYDAYRFGIARGYYSLYETLAQGDTVLTADGTKQLRVPLPGNERGAPASLQFSATVTDPSRQEQSDQATVTLHPGLFYIGLKPETTFLDLSRDQVMALDVATVDPNGAPVGAENLKVELIRQQWNSVREVGGDGRLRWRSERTEEVVGSRTVETEAGRAVRLRMPVRLGGSYIVRATGYDVRGNVIKTEAYFYATGAGYVAWERSDDDHLDLVADKKSYAPGETARILVPSPYEQATALVTVEREGIISSRVVEVEGSAPQIEVPLGEQHLPNAFVSVILLSGRTAQPSAGEDLGAPSFKIGYVNLPVSAQGRHLTVEVEPGSETYEPGGSVTVDLRLTDDGGRGVEGEIAFAAADAGVLNLIGYAMPDPFQTFYGPRALGVTTSETLANLVEQRDFGEKEEDEGGGGGEDADRLLRSDFRPLAHWAPAIRTDGSGRATVTFDLPENLTTFRLMAVGLTRDHRFGQGQTDIVVTKPLVLQPALPRFARLGDTFEAGVLVTNRTGQAGPAVVTARADGIALDGEARRTVTLAKGETREVRFAWDIEQLGTANLRFTAELGSERDGLEVPLDIALPVTKEASATFASTSDTAREALVLPSDRVPGVGQVEVRIASTAMVGLDGATRYLFQYPYGCLEQRTSRIRPLLVADDLLDLFDLDALDGDRATVVNEWLGSLDAYWMGRGFALWKGGRFVSPYATAYAVLALAEADAAGFDVPQPLTREAVDALATLVKDSSLQPDYYTRDVWDTSRALMLYALARHDRVLEAEVQALAERTTQPTATPSAELQSHLLRTIALADRASLNGYAQPLADGLRGRTTTEGTTAYLAAQTGDAWGWIFSSDVRSTAFGMTALIESTPSSDVRQLTERMVQYLIRSRTTGHWASTQENAAVLDALRAYQVAFETTDPNFTATVQLAGREVLSASFRGRSLTAEEATVDPTAMPSGEELPIEVNVDGTGRAYYSLLAETYTSAPVQAANRGLAVQRTIQRLDGSGNPVGNPVTTDSRTLTLDAGQLVRVTLRLTSPATRNYVVVDDALPAGLEALNPAFQTSGVLAQQETGSGQWWGSFNHTELRDDRVLLFADYLRRGEHTYTYLARATTPGTFVHPPAQAELMYEPAVNGRTATGTVVVRASEGVGV